MKKLICMLLAVTLCSGVLAGCQNNTNGDIASDGAVDKGSEGNSELTLDDLNGKTIDWFTCQGKFKQEYYDMAAKVEELYGVKVEFNVVPDNEFFQMIQVKLATDEVPDIFEYNLPLQNAELNVYETCEDLSNEPWVSRLVNPDIALDISDGKLYALPMTSIGATIGIFYNKDVFEECGLDPDASPADWDEFLEMCQTIRDHGIDPLYMTNGDSWTTQIFMGGQIPIALGDDAQEVYDGLRYNTTTFGDEEVFVDVLTKFKTLIDSGYVNEDHLSASYSTAAETLATGKAAMYYINSPCAIDIMAKYPDTNLGSFAIPMNGNDALPIVNLVQSLFVPSAGKQVDIAKLFLQAWSDPEVQNIFFETQPGFPAMNDVDGGTPIQVLVEQNERYVDTGKTVSQLNDSLSYMTACNSELFTQYVEVAAGNKTPQEALDYFQKVYADFMQQEGYEEFQ